MKIVGISKSYGRKVSIDYQTWDFHGSLSAEVQIENDRDLIEASDKLFSKVYNLVERDIERIKNKIKPQDGEVNI